MTNKIEHFLWQEKYRPTTLADYINSNTELAAKAPIWIEQRQIPHMILVGPVGTGKTTLAMILANHVAMDPADILFINASTHNSVETIRNTINSFAYTSSLGGGLKVVILDEADRLSVQAQDSLRATIEEVSMHVRFIMTGNHGHKFTEASTSRLERFQVSKPDYLQVLERSVYILDKENVEFDAQTLETIIGICNNDLRKVIQELQRRSTTGVLQLPDASDKIEASYRYELLDLIVAGDWNQARKIVCKQVQGDEWDDLYRFMYLNISKNSKFAEDSDEYGEAIVYIAEHLYRHAYVADPEINCAAMFIKIGAI